MTGAAHALDSVPGLAALAARQQGVVTRAQLRSLGVDDQAVRHQRDARRWVVVSPQVICLFTGPLPRTTRIWAGALHSQPHGLVCAWTGLEVRGLRRWERGAVHVAIERGTTVRPAPGLVIHESRRLVLARDRDAALGLPVVRAARAAIDAAAWSARPAHASALLAAVAQQRIASPSELAAELDAAGQVRHRKAMLQALAQVSAGADSLGEIRIGPILAAAGLPAPRRQTPHVLGGVLRRTDIEVDLPDGSVLVIEVDGPAHDSLSRRAADALRDLDHLAEHRIPLRVTPWMLVHRRAELIERLIAVREAAEHRMRLAAPDR